MLRSVKGVRLRPPATPSTKATVVRPPFQGLAGGMGALQAAAAQRGAPPAPARRDSVRRAAAPACTRLDLRDCWCPPVSIHTGKSETANGASRHGPAFGRRCYLQHPLHGPLVMPRGAPGARAVGKLHQGAVPCSAGAPEPAGAAGAPDALPAGWKGGATGGSVACTHGTAGGSVACNPDPTPGAPGAWNWSGTTPGAAVAAWPPG